MAREGYSRPPVSEPASRLSGVGVTQVATLDEADTQVRTYRRSIFHTDFSDAVIDIALPDDAHEFSLR
jgi:hypothetical protein